MPMPASATLRERAASSRRPAGRTRGASSTTSTQADQLADRSRGARAHRRAVRDRGRDPRPAARRARCDPAGTRRAAARRTAARGCEQRSRRVSKKSELAGAIRYALTRWTALTRYRDDGRIEIDNNAAERALRAVALGRQELPVRRLGRRRRARRRDLQPDRHGQAQRARSRGLPALRARAHRRASDQPHRRAAAMDARRTAHRSQALGCLSRCAVKYGCWVAVAPGKERMR